jgi:hypothetical protein
LTPLTRWHRARKAPPVTQRVQHVGLARFNQQGGACRNDLSARVREWFSIARAAGQCISTAQEPRPPRR